MTEIDPAPYFASFFAQLQSIGAIGDYTSPPVGDAVATSARAAKAGGVLPERMLAYLRHHLHEAPLSAVGDWYRGVLVERLIAHAITAYFDFGDLSDARTPSDHTTRASVAPL